MGCQATLLSKISQSSAIKNLATVSVSLKQVNQLQLFLEEFVGNSKKSPMGMKLSSGGFLFLRQCKPLCLNSLVPKSDTDKDITHTLLHPRKVLTAK